MTAIRLTFAYDTAGVRLIDRTPVGKPVGATDDPGAASVGPGTLAAELRTADQRATFRRLLPAGAVPPDAEVFDPDVAGGVRRDPTPLPAGVFTVIVPDDQDAAEVVLIAAPAVARRLSTAGTAQADLSGGPVEIARFPFRDR